MEMWITFTAIWTLGATIDEDGRKAMDLCVRDLKPIFSHEGTIYDYKLKEKKLKENHESKRTVSE